jgi:hypothetical protein
VPACDPPGHLMGQGRHIPEPAQPETKSQDGRCDAKGEAVGQRIEVGATGRALAPAAATYVFGIGTFGGLPPHTLVGPLRCDVQRLVISMSAVTATSVPTTLISRQVSPGLAGDNLIIFSNEEADRAGRFSAGTSTPTSAGPAARRDAGLPTRKLVGSAADTQASAPSP